MASSQFVSNLNSFHGTITNFLSGIQQYIDASGKAQVFMNSTNQPTTIYLNETEASSVSQISGKRSSYELQVEDRDTDLAKRQTSGNCGCVWLWT